MQPSPGREKEENAAFSFWSQKHVEYSGADVSEASRGEYCLLKSKTAGIFLLYFFGTERFSPCRQSGDKGSGVGKDRLSSGFGSMKITRIFSKNAVLLGKNRKIRLHFGHFSYLFPSTGFPEKIFSWITVIHEMYSSFCTSCRSSYIEYCQFMEKQSENTGKCERLVLSVFQNLSSEGSNASVPLFPEVDLPFSVSCSCIIRQETEGSFIFCRKKHSFLKKAAFSVHFSLLRHYKILQDAECRICQMQLVRHRADLQMRP